MKNLKYDGVGFNAEWVAGFKTEKQFLSAPEVKHLFAEKEPEARATALQEVYALCQPSTKATAPTSSANQELKGEE